GILKRPATGANIGTPRDPIAFDIQDLLGDQPFETLAHLRQRPVAAHFEQGMTSEPGVPDRRYARLAIALTLVHHQQLLDRRPRDSALRMMLRIAQRVEHHHAVRHRRKDRAETVIAVEALTDPCLCALDRASPRSLRKERLERMQQGIESTK